jgi:hypothetical protein
MSILLDGLGGVTTPAETIATNLTFTGTGNRITGDFSNATHANRVSFQSSTVNGATTPFFIPNGTSNFAGVVVANASDPTNSSYGQLRANSTSVDLISGILGTGTYLPMTFYTGGSERARIDSAGNLGWGGTPSAWDAGYKAIQIASGQPTALMGASNQTELVTNAYYGSAAWRYVGSSVAASRYSQQSGVHYWYNAPSGTAGNAITFTQAMTLDSSGNLLVGTTGSTIVTSTANAIIARAANGSLLVHHENGNSGSNFSEFGYNSTTIGTISQNSTTTVGYNTSSDYRLKNTIAPMMGALDKIAQLKPVTYKWNVDGSDGQGFIAHELAEIVPECVNGEKDAVDEDGNPKYQGVDTSFLVATLTAAIQELKAIVDAQAVRIAALEA